MIVRFRNDPGNDPVVQAWDAFVLGDRGASGAASPETLVVLDALTSLIEPIEPDVTFLDKLEKQLFDPGNMILPGVLEFRHAYSGSVLRAIPSRSGSDRTLSSRLLSAAALLAVFVAGAIGLLLMHEDQPSPREIPAAIDAVPVFSETPGTGETEPQPEPLEALLDIQIDPADLDAAEAGSWDRMEFAEVHVDAGERFTTDHPYFSCCAGIAVFQLREGSAAFFVNGPVDFYAGTGAQPPLRIDPQTLITVEPGQTVVLAMNAIAVVTNTGEDELVLLGAYGYLFSDVTGANAVPPGYRDTQWVVDFNMEALPNGPVAIELEFATLEPGKFTHVLVDENERLVGFHVGTTSVYQTAGAVTSLPEDRFKATLVHSMVFSSFPAGPYTLVNAGNDPTSFYFMRLSFEDPATDASPTPDSSPVAGPISLETARYVAE